MNQKKFFVYVINSRVLWVSETLFHIPVLDDLYSIHLVKKNHNFEPGACLQHTVKNSYKFLQDELALSPINEDELPAILTNHEKIKVYVHLCDCINYSYLSALPPVFFDEQDKIEMLSRSLLNENLTESETNEKHSLFVNNLIQDKKTELKKRFISIVHELKTAKTLQEVQKIGCEVVFDGINVV